MNRENKDLEYVGRLAERIQEYRKEISLLEGRKKRLEILLDNLRKDLATAERFFEMELKKLRLKEEQVRLPLEGKARFVGMKPRNACTVLLMEHGEMTLEEMVEKLTESGFEFRGSPKRTVNMALLNRKDIERLEGGLFRYVGEGS